MGYMLLWIESLAAMLLFSALLAAGAARAPKRWRRRLNAGLELLIVALLCGFAILCFYYMESPSLPYIVAWSVAALLGTIAILILALRQLAGQSWRIKRLFAAFAAALILTLITFTNLDLAIQLRLSSLRAEAFAKALTLSPPHIPDRQNAASLYLKAFQNFPSSDEQVQFLTVTKVDQDAPRSKGVKTPIPPDVIKLLQKYQSTLALLHAGAMRPDCYFINDYSTYNQDTFKHCAEYLIKLRFSVDMLAEDARLRLDQGNFDAGVNDLEAIFTMAQHVGGDRLMINQLMSDALEDIGFETLQSLALTYPEAHTRLAALKLDADLSYMDSFRKSVQYEMLFFGRVISYSNFETGMSSYVNVRQWQVPVISALVLPAYRVLILSDQLVESRWWAEKFSSALAAGSYQASLAKFKAIPKVPAKYFLQHLDTTPMPRWLYGVAGADAYHRLALTAIGCLKYRAKHGEYPASLDRLVPECIEAIPLDPFDETPLKLIRREGEVRIYSVGGNLKDDQGEVNGDWDKGDIVFRLKDGALR